MLFDKEKFHRCVAGKYNNCVDDELLLKGAEHTLKNNEERRNYIEPTVLCSLNHIAFRPSWLFSFQLHFCCSFNFFNFILYICERGVMRGHSTLNMTMIMWRDKRHCRKKIKTFFNLITDTLCSFVNNFPLLIQLMQFRMILLDIWMTFCKKHDFNKKLK